MGRARRKRKPGSFKTESSPAKAGKSSVANENFPTRSAIPKWWPEVAVFALVVIVYLPAVLWGEFIWDDVIMTDATAVKDSGGLWQIWLNPTEAISGEGHYWPLVYSTFWLENRIWGFWPNGYHAVNVLLHAVNSVLVLCIARRLAIPGAILVAALFAVHPLHVESVAWVIERKDVLSGLFYLASVLTWFRFVKRPGWRDYFLVIVFFSAGLLSKSVVVTLPMALLIWHWWRGNRITELDLLRLVPLFAIGLAIAGADFAFYQSFEPLDLGYSLFERTVIAAHAFWFYVGKLFWPFDLSIIYPFWDHANPYEWFYVGAIAVTAGGMWIMRRRWGRGPIACFLFFAVTLSPALGFIDYGFMQYSFVADRFQYLAGFGVIALAVGTLVPAVDALGKMTGVPHFAHRSVRFIALVVVGVFAWQSWQQTRIYRDNVTFNSHIVAVNPVAKGAHLNLSAALMDQGYFDDALAAIETAVQLDPDSYRVHFNLGLILAELGRHDEALAAIETAVQLDPDSSMVQSNLGLILAELGRYDEALAAASRAIEIDPKGDNVFLNQSKVLISMGRVVDAEESLRRANQEDPGRFDILQNLGESLRHQNKFEAAVAVFDEALKIMPESALAHAARGTALHKAGRYIDSVSAIERALDLAPELPQAASLLEMSGQALMEVGLPEKALEYFEKALSLDPTLAGAKRGRERVRGELGKQ